ncbi:BREX-1 system adenine-specific DNA-methyltransferase PglX [Zobellella taiwanensis]
MNTANIKKYAPKARKDFIAAMTRQAAKVGITAKGTEPMELRGDLALIGERAFPRSIARAREALARRVQQQGFAQTMDQAAYSWFNRLCAIRYMEIQGYLDHGRRVLSTASGEPGTPQILDDCLDIDLDALDSGLDRQKITELKLDGTKDEELYRELLLAQCHALHRAMPFLFEAVDDATELLLPDNLTKTDSLVRELVSAVPEQDWSNIEIIGWLYQFYISEKKEQVIGKVVKSEDIPAATQLFTPNWIVQYLVQNSVGRQWLQTYPDSPLKSQMPYYIAPAEQTEEVQAQLAAITPASIEPESIKVLDPACGSGHILIEAYKVLKAIYEERGYRSRDIPALILNNNLFGLDIDDRAGQLAGFALLMLARKDDRRLFGRVAAGEVKLNVLALEETTHLDLPGLWQALNLAGSLNQGSSDDLFAAPDAAMAKDDPRYALLERTLARFVKAKTFGSLIDVPEQDAEPLKALLLDLEELADKGDSMQKPAAEALAPYVQQAWILAQRYDAVIANPPYMGSKGMNMALKDFAKKAYPDSKSDLFAIFMEHAFSLLKPAGYNAQINMQSWMFLSSFEKLRAWLLENKTILTMAHLGARAFSQISGEVVQTTAWVIKNTDIEKYQPTFFRLVEGAEESKRANLLKGNFAFKGIMQSDFNKITGSPIAYYSSHQSRVLYSTQKSLSEVSSPRQGLITGDTERFIKFWFEVSFNKIGFDFNSRDSAECSKCKWFPIDKGGEFKKWYGNNEFVVNWLKDGEEIRNFTDGYGKLRSRPQNMDFYFREGATWTKVSSSNFSVRYSPKGHLFSDAGMKIFSDTPSSLNDLIGFLNSNLTPYFLSFLSETINYEQGNISRLPVLEVGGGVVSQAISIAKSDWDSYELSWGFSGSPFLNVNYIKQRLRDSYPRIDVLWRNLVQQAKCLEEDNNRLFIEAYGLQDELTPEVPLEEITLTCNPHYRYGGKLTDQEREDRLQSDTLAELVSYAIGCIMGRYSLDKPGLILASQGETIQDYLAQIPEPRFMPDDDAILPLTDLEWFPDDATNRFREFVATVWGEEHLQANLDFVAESLCLYAIKPKRGESAMDTIRRYLSTQFYKDHLKTYKKRPIYWLFSSGKQKAFECLVYLHRYNEGTLARMRTEYVIPLTAKLATYVDKLEQDKDASSSAAETKRLEKEIAALHKQQAELASFDEKLRHYADMRISLDLDDGVKVNYGKFGDLLANVKDVTGEKPQ